MLCFIVAARAQNTSDPVTYSLWRAGEGNGMWAVCPLAGKVGRGGGSQRYSVDLWSQFSLTSSEFNTQPPKCSKWALHSSDSSESAATHSFD